MLNSILRILRILRSSILRTLRILRILCYSSYSRLTAGLQPASARIRLPAGSRKQEAGCRVLPEAGFQPAFSRLPAASCFLLPASCFLQSGTGDSCFLLLASCFLHPTSCTLLPSCFQLPASASCRKLRPAPKEVTVRHLTASTSDAARLLNDVIFDGSWEELDGTDRVTL